MKNLLNYFRLIKMINKANIHLAWYKILEEIMDFVTRVQKDGKPRLTRIASIDMSKEKIIGDSDLVSLWAGVGDANPIERCRHLKAQNVELKRLLKLCSDKMQPGGNEDLSINVKIVLDTFE